MHTTHTSITYRNLLKTISALSYSKPELSICSATKLASVNSGGFRPISVKCIKMLLLNCRCRMVRTLSPTHTNMVELASWPLSAIRERMYRATLECTLPHRPLSEEMATIRCLGFLSSSNISAFSNKAKFTYNNITTVRTSSGGKVCVPCAPSP